MQLKDQTAIITGAGSGIGEATALLFAREHAKVIIADADRDSANRVAGAVEERKGTAFPYQVDVSNEQNVKAMIEETVNMWGRIDILVSNAGIGIAAEIVKTSLKDWERVMAVNVTGTFLCCKFVIPVMLNQGGGIIVNTASVGGIVGLVNRAVYTASKFAIIGITKSIAADYAERNIRCNAVCPGTIDSPWIEKILASAPDKAVKRKQMENRQLIKRMGTPAEIAHAILFLASPQSSFIHGSAMLVDGGMTAV